MPLSFDISMGVAKGNEDLKGRLETAIDRRQAEILAILEEYGVPLVTSGGGSAAVPAEDGSGAAPSRRRIQRCPSRGRAPAPRTLPRSPHHHRRQTSRRRS